MNQKLKEKIQESLSAVLPVTAIVLLISIFITPMEIGTISIFLFGALMLIIGMGLFQLGAEMAMMPLGEGIGAQISKNKRIYTIAIIVFIIGVFITIAEPDLQVLAEQVPDIPNNLLLWTVAIGVGLCLMFAVLRILFKLSLPAVLVILYGVVILLSLFAPENFVPLAFDSGGATTGPITVPFILALGVGLASVRSDKNASDDSFGLVAISSIGPIMAVIILGIFYNPSSASYTPTELANVVTTQDVLREFMIALPHYAVDVFWSVIPIVGIFLVFQIASKRFHRKQILHIIVGFVYSYAGLVLFLTGVGVGFSPVGSLLGSELAASSFKWLLIPIGMLIGYFIVKAEPAIQVLNKQVEGVTEGAISSSAMNTCLSIGVAVSVGLAMLRSILGISIYWIILPGYAIALILSFFVPKIFVGIAFDSGGVASGPMTSTFLLPLSIGVAESLGRNVMSYAFGVIALVAMTPLIAVQIMGLVYKIKSKKQDIQPDIPQDDVDEIVDLEGDKEDG